MQPPHLPPHVPLTSGRIHPVHPDGDEAIRQTDSDAALARFSAVQKSYISDPFVRYLLPRGAHLQPPRPPLINIGTYVRSEGIDQLVNGWLELSAKANRQCQIVSLGAGSDTRFWRIAARRQAGPRAGTLATYIEVDFAENTTKKAMAIRKSKDLSALLGKAEDVKLASGGTSLHSPRYHLLAADLRLSPNESLAPILTKSLPGSDLLLSSDLPTLLIFECVLVYMSPEASESLIQWFADYFSTSSNGVLGGIVYEMFGLHDSFGKVMLNNLKARNVSLPGVESYPNLASLPERFTRHGFTTSYAFTLRDLRRACISESELERISHLEMLDEIEELELVLQHYAITWGVKLNNPEAPALWKGWGFIHT